MPYDSDHFLLRRSKPKSHKIEAETYLGAGGGYRCKTCHKRLKTIRASRNPANAYQHTEYDAP